MLAGGRYPSDEFAELRPRIVWDRVTGTLRGRAGAQRLAVVSGGTIPDRGLFAVNLFDGHADSRPTERGFAAAGVAAPPGGRRPGRRIGELDEEMVYEMRPGQTFILGASSWKVVDITHSEVLVVPAPGEPGTIAFWHGDALGRPVELGREIGRLTREIRAMPPDQAMTRLRDASCLDELAARNLLAFLDEQASATGAVPDDRTIVVERFRDQLGDWRLCVLNRLGRFLRHGRWRSPRRSRSAPAPRCRRSTPTTALRSGSAKKRFCTPPLTGPLFHLAIPRSSRNRHISYGEASLFASPLPENAAARPSCSRRRRPQERTAPEAAAAAES